VLVGTGIVMTIGADVGTTCPAAERLLAAIGATRTNIAVYDDVGRLLGGDETKMPLVTPNDAVNAVNPLVKAVETGVIRSADAPATAEEFAALVVQTPDVDYYREVIPALLVVAGRLPEALAALDAYRDKYRESDYDDFCDRFGGFIEAGTRIPAPGAVAFPASAIGSEQAVSGFRGGAC